MNYRGQPVEGSHNYLSGDAADAYDDSPTTSLSHLNINSNIQVDGEESAGHSLAIASARPPATWETEASEKSIEAKPRNQNEQAHTEQAKEPTISTPPKALAVEPKLLLVDDNVINLIVLTKYALKLSKMPATSVSGGQEAIDAFRNAIKPDDGTAAQPFDVIFLDLSMPEVSGFDVARQIREMEAQLQCNRTYICALTGLVSGKDRNAAYASGVDNYLVRPTRLRDLQGVVEIWRSNLAAR
jgi:CheY-like chemotaxis protein